MRGAFLIILFLISIAGYSQQFQVIDVSQSKGKVIINYNVNPQYRGEKYKVDIYGSHDNYTRPLQYVSGDVGDDVVSDGNTLSIEWNAQRELKTFDGQIQFELRGIVTYVPIHSVGDRISAKQKKETTVRWEGGGSSDRIGIDLVRDGRIVKRLDDVNNTGEYRWIVGTDLDKGAGYELQLQNLSNSGESFQTNPFKISGGLPIWMIIGPGAVIAAGVVYIVTSGGDGPSGTEEADLPSAPGVPSGG